MTTRRDFFKVLFAAGVASAVPAVLSEELPTIYGDGGVNCDADGIAAAVAGKPFLANHGCVTVEKGIVNFHGSFSIWKPIHVHSGDVCLEGNQSLIRAMKQGSMFVIHEGVKNLSLRNFVFVSSFEGKSNGDLRFYESPETRNDWRTYASGSLLVVKRFR